MRAYLGRGARLLDDELDDVVRRAAARVVHRLALLDELEGGEPAHAVLLGEILVLVAVNLGTWDGGAMMGARDRWMREIYNLPKKRGRLFCLCE